MRWWVRWAAARWWCLWLWQCWMASQFSLIVMLRPEQNNDAHLLRRRRRRWGIMRPVYILSNIACAGAEIRAFLPFMVGKNWWAAKNYKNNIEVEGAKFFCRDASIMTNDNCPALQVNCKLFPFLVISKTTNEYVFFLHGSSKLMLEV